MKKTVAAVTLLPVIIIGGAIFASGRLKSVSLPEKIDIASNGASEYVIVRPDGCKFPITAACSNLSRGIKKQTGADIKVVTDKTDRYAAGARIPCEIIVGETNRHIECDATNNLRYDDFAVCVHGKDLVITAGNDDGYERAAEYITDSLVSNGNLSLPDNFIYVEKGDYATDTLVIDGKNISEYTVVYGNTASKKYADGLAELVRTKTGYMLDVYDKQADISIVFDTKAEIGRDEYKITSENGKIVVSSPTGTGLEAAYQKLSEALFGKEEKTVKIENINIDGKLEASSEYGSFIKERAGLSNTYNKLEKDKKLTVAYFGGSVTVGFSATDRAKDSWRALTTSWLAENFPDAEVVEINSAVGASGSHLGTFRVQRDIIAHKPDLLFVEYSINDCYNGETEATAAENYESLVRQVRKALPECDIVNVYITDSGRASGGGDFAIKSGYERVADAYGIPSLDVGKALITKKSLRGNSSPEWKKYFTDIVHMTDAGFAEYAKVIEEYLAKELIFGQKGETKAHSLPEMLNEKAGRELQYILASEEMLENSKGFTFEKGPFEGGTVPKYEGYLKTSTADNSLTFTFTGTELSLFMSSYTSGTVTYEVDGKKWRADRNSMNNPFPIVKNLEYGEHTITMQFGFKDSTVANIGAFLVR